MATNAPKKAEPDAEGVKKAPEQPAEAAPAVSEDQQRAAEKRAAALESPDQNDRWIAALLEERRGYVTRGLKDRVAQVDEQLKARGYKGSKGE